MEATQNKYCYSVEARPTIGPSPEPLELGSWVFAFKINEIWYLNLSGELLWRSQFKMDFYQNWHTCANSFYCNLNAF